MSAPAGSSRRILDAAHPDFAELSALETDLLKAVKGQEALEEKLRGFFRSSIDEVIDTTRSKRFFFCELEKTEKTYLGTKFEILLRDWLKVPRGIKLDLKIGGREVDVKSTTAGSGWMIPPEAFGQLCILLRVNEKNAKCAVGIVRAREEYLRPGKNRDSKRSFAAAGRVNIWWLVADFPYTPNFWEVVSEVDRQTIMSLRGGTNRLEMLFERYLEVPISRVQIAAVAAQDDFMKRLRANGGARDRLAPKGIAILYSEKDRDLMNKLGLEFGFREFMSFKPRNADEEDMLRKAGKIV